MGVLEPTLEELPSPPWAMALPASVTGKLGGSLPWLSGLQPNASVRPTMAQDLSYSLFLGLPGFGSYLQPGCPALEGGGDTVQGEAWLGRLPKG